MSLHAELASKGVVTGAKDLDQWCDSTESHRRQFVYCYLRRKCVSDEALVMAWAQEGHVEDHPEDASFQEELLGVQGLKRDRHGQQHQTHDGLRRHQALPDPWQQR